MLKLSNTGKPMYQKITEGTHILTCVSVDNNEEFGFLTLGFHDENSHFHRERFYFVKNDGSRNDVAINMFTNIARKLMSDNSLVEVDENQLVGKQIQTTVVYTTVEGKGKYEGRTFTNCRLTKIKAVPRYDVGFSV